MKSAFGCFQQAAKCQGMAWRATSGARRTAHLAVALYWRTLGDQATIDEEFSKGKRPA
jgi:hypothetical protein